MLASLQASQAEGCFLIIIRKSKKGWQLEACFTINLHIRDIELLKLIQTNFDDEEYGE